MRMPPAMKMSVAAILWGVLLFVASPSFTRVSLYRPMTHRVTSATTPG